MPASTSRLRNMRLRAMARRPMGPGPRRAMDSSNFFHPNKSGYANKPKDVTFKSSATEGSPSRGVIVLVIIPPGVKEGSKVRISAGGINGVALRVPDRSAWFVSRLDGRTEERYFMVRFDATVIHPQVAQEVTRESKQPSREVPLYTAEDKTQSTDDVNSRESIHTAVLMQEHVRRAVDQFAGCGRRGQSTRACPSRAPQSPMCWD
ncbi:hypothetical protein THAOC_12032 [Thalassiosira oceanica]|uniref:Uncharacterized protein n=1 Tax=Thalassiosira oceanica TaxID=159749 RepID=K0SPR5_THAOC|nr:hypothetical protein THAOC_12032 [Thalassiosira oceanica]|eukprot:EJK66989.1 hypothetical protein THAOC_12032 [Thalassiosira oceanica]